MPNRTPWLDPRLFDGFSHTGISEPENTDIWEVIVKYDGDIAAVGAALNAQVEIMNDNYAIFTLKRESIPRLYDFPQTLYAELPRALSMMIAESSTAACLSRSRLSGIYQLTGRGTLVAIIDSGIDFTHPDFRNPDGTTRLISLWDQTTPGTPPPGFFGGSEYPRERLNEALAQPDPFALVPSQDTIGHGTAVASIACGNGRASGGREAGVAPEAEIIAVKLGQRGHRAFARTTELMRAVKYALDIALERRLPVVINLSYGSNNGSHDGHSLFSDYLNQMSEQWKCSIVTATGNEGIAGHHYSARLAQGEKREVAFHVAPGIQSLYLTLWKNFVDTFVFELVSPAGVTTGTMLYKGEYLLMHLGLDTVIVLFGQPTHFSESQEIYIAIKGGGESIATGQWHLLVNGQDVTDGRFDIWLPTTEEVTDRTAFLLPDPGTTLTIPSTTHNLISVGAFNHGLNTVAAFSGRGYTRNSVYVKPDLVAPGVNIVAANSGGGYASFTGTSMAAPFVSGSAALMMEWGIVQNRDPFLYGQRIKAFLQKGARRDPRRTYPDPDWGYGALCLEKSLELLAQYAVQYQT